MKNLLLVLYKIAVSVYCVPAERHKCHNRHLMAGEVGYDPTTQGFHTTLYHYSR